MLNVTKFEIETTPTESVLMVKEMKILFTELKVRLGCPLLYNKVNANEQNIIPTIPAEAKSVAAEISPSESVDPALGKSGKSSTAKKSYKPIKALALYEKGWTIKARLVSKGMKRECKTRQSSFIMPLELMDEEDTTITALLCGEAVETYDRMLEKGKVYLFSNGEVKIAIKKFSSVKNDFTLYFDDKSTIELIEDDKNIKGQAFNFTLVKNIAHMPEGSVIDVLGIITMAGSKQLHVAKKGKPGEAATGEEKMFKRNIIICDESAASISVTLWREHAELDLVQGKIIGLKRVKVSSFNDKQLNTFKLSEVIFEPPHKRFETLKQM